jgi:ankyrin repeat protein
LGYLLNYIPADWETIQQYVTWGCNPKLLTKSGENLVNYLVRRNYCEAIPQALKWGASVHAKNENGEAPVLGSFECVKVLIDNGADVNAKGNINFPSYLATAVNKNNPEEIAYLLQKGANPNGTYMNSAPFIFQFIEEGNLEMLKLFVAYNADYKWKNRNNQNALDFAIVKSNQEIIAFLRSKGAKTTKESIEYEAAIVEEIKSVIKLIDEKNTTQIKAIWAKYPDMTFDDKTYKKLYALSIEANDLELLEVLYDKKVNPNMALNFEEQNAVHLAVLQSNLDLVTLLVAKGVDPNKTDAKGNKPIFYAKSRKIKKYLSNVN